MNYDPSQIFNVFAGAGVGFIILYVALLVFSIICWWLVFRKAGQPGWAILIPVYNLLVMLRVAGKPWWWILFFLVALLAWIPILGQILMLGLLVVFILIMHGISKSFGQGAGFTVGLVLLNIIFVAILAFGKYKWSAPAAKA